MAKTEYIGDSQKGNLHVDLYNTPEYDDAKCEYNISLKEGGNTFSAKLYFGDEHPDSCQIRIFTTENVEVYISDLEVNRAVIIDMYYPILLVSFVVAILISSALVLMPISDKKDESKKRQDDIDVFRGIGILLMVMGHIGFGRKFDLWIHAFHMPMFFVVSGLFYPNTKKIEPLTYIIKKVKTLLVPYFSFGIFHALVYLMVEGRSNLTPIRNLMWKNTVSLPIAHALWFLTTLFLTDIIFYFIDRYIHSESWKALSIIMISLVGNYETQIFPWKLPYGLGSAFAGLALYYAGYLLRRFSEDRIIKRIMNLPFLLSVVAYCAVHILIFENGSINMRVNMYGCVPLYLIVAISASIVGINLSRYICRYAPKILKNSLVFMGRNSIVFVCLNQLAIKEIKLILEYVGLNGKMSNVLLLLFVCMYLFIVTKFIKDTKLSIFIGMPCKIKK